MAKDSGSPSNDVRRAAGVNLDNAPPPPPSLSGPTNQLSGILGQGPSAQGSDAMSGIVQTAMQIEQGIQQLAASVPGFDALAAQIVNVLRMGITKGLQSIGSQNMSPAPGAGMPNAPQPLQPPSPTMGPQPGAAPAGMAA